ncbi:hypothetical protein KL940_005420 [Ogataea angusta]|uniref:Uncharacterized protein n=1 Tax=Pichia angusta TaxID=870730 RepID=A0ABQ7RP79_PICAN|nr:hypothetical protein KL940_005420 [Ogataea angusta]
MSDFYLVDRLDSESSDSEVEMPPGANEAFSEATKKRLRECRCLPALPRYNTDGEHTAEMFIKVVEMSGARYMTTAVLADYSLALNHEVGFLMHVYSLRQPKWNKVIKFGSLTRNMLKQIVQQTHPNRNIPREVAALFHACGRLALSVGLNLRTGRRTCTR